MIDTHAKITDQFFARENSYLNQMKFGNLTLQLGRVVNVPNEYGTDRVIDVVTIDDRRFDKCQVMDPFGSPFGFGIEAAPVINSMALIAITEGFRPYVIGFSKIVDPSTGLIGPPDDEPLLPGDYRMKTIGGNKVHLYSGGAIGIVSNEQCKTLYLPRRYLISHFCKNWELFTDAGFEKWEKVDIDTGECLYTKKVYRWDKKGQIPVVQEFQGNAEAETGAVDVKTFGNGTTEIGDIKIFDDGTMLLTYRDGNFFNWDNTNKQLDVKLPAVWMQMKKDGTFSIICGAGGVKATINYDGVGDVLAVTQNSQGNQIQMTKDGIDIVDGVNANTINLNKDGVTINADVTTINGSSLIVNTNDIFAGKDGVKGAGNGVVTGFPSGTHPTDFWTGLPIKGLSIFGAG